MIAVTPVRTGPLPDHKLALAADQRRVTDFHSGHIRDRVPFSRRSLKRNTEIARSDRFDLGRRSCRQGFLRLAPGGVQHDDEREQEHEDRSRF